MYEYLLIENVHPPIKQPAGAQMNNNNDKNILSFHSLPPVLTGIIYFFFTYLNNAKGRHTII